MRKVCWNSGGILSSSEGDVPPGRLRGKIGIVELLLVIIRRAGGITRFLIVSRDIWLIDLFLTMVNNSDEGHFGSSDVRFPQTHISVSCSSSARAGATKRVA